MQSRRKVKQSAGRHGEKFWEEEKDSVGFRLMQGMGWEKGKGLGKNESGSVKYIRAKQKKDFAGIGGDSNRDDTWFATQGLFNDLLTRLNTSNQDDFDPAAEPEEDEEKITTSGQALKQYVAKHTLYNKFKKAKDTSNYSKKDMAEIFGRTEPKAKPEKPKQKTELESSVLTSVSSVSMKDYFAKKLAASNKKATQFNTASGHGFTMDQQEDYYTRQMSSATSGKRGLGFGGAGGAARPSAPGWSTGSYGSESRGGLGSGSSGLGFKSASSTPVPAAEAKPKKDKKKKKKSKKSKEIKKEVKAEAVVTEKTKKSKKKKKRKLEEIAACTTPTGAKKKKKKKKSQTEPVTAVPEAAQKKNKKNKKNKKSKKGAKA